MELDFGLPGQRANEDILKYFIEATRPRAMYTLGPLADCKLAKHTMYEVTSEQAHALYMESANCENIAFGEVEQAWKDGYRVYVDLNSVVICGIEMTDKQVFEGRLKGNIGKAILK